ncbi:efflux RND transporter periplasmic adaptor subunit, partial [Methylibium sp.]|uniref:efflux RND transporter periplasmic adaptor subunit n=1 Tax=Methylibium sp. TaxID=2067992 RepID=UPI00286C5C02
VSYRTAVLERGSLQSAVASSGTVNPVSQVSVGSQVSGQIKEMRADFNTEVKQGQLIARIDPESFEYKVRQASADLESARAAVLNAQANIAAVLAGVSKARLDADNAQRDAVRKQDLLERQFISQADFESSRNTAGTLAEALKVTQAQADVARAQAVAAQAVVRQREAALAQAKVDLEHTEIRSPVDGVVIKRSVSVGQTVAASLQAPELFIIARNLSDMQVEVAIDEADIGRVRTGQAVSFTVDAFAGRRYEGKVNTVRKSALNTANVVTYTAVVAFTNTGEQVLPGMTANVRIVTDARADVRKLPNAALRVRLTGVAEPAASEASAAARARAASQPGSGAERNGAGVDGVGGGGGGNGAQQVFREGLATQVGLSAAQLEKVDTLSAALRPRFAALRELPEDERAKAAERVRGELRLQVAALLTPEQKPKYEQWVAETAGRGASTRARVYVLDDDGKPRAVAVRVGISDGSMSELLGGELQLGQEVVIGTLGAANTGPGGGGPGGRQGGGPRGLF